MKVIEDLVQLDSLRTRMLLWVEDEITFNRLPPKAGNELEAVLYRGELTILLIRSSNALTSPGRQVPASFPAIFSVQIQQCPPGGPDGALRLLSAPDGAEGEYPSRPRVRPRYASGRLSDVWPLAPRLRG